MIAIFPKIAECAASKDIEKLACMIRNYFAKDGVFAPILNLESIYADLGIPIRRLPIEGIAAMPCKDQGGAFSVAAIIHPTKCQRPEEERFLLAHLLGHFFLHIQPFIARGDWKTSGILIDDQPNSTYVMDNSKNEKDRDANLFAAALTMPKSLITRASEKFTDHSKMAAFFGVDANMIEQRLAKIQAATAQISAAPTVTSDTRTQHSRKQSPKSSVKANQNSNLQGMARLRQIAKDLDNGY